MFCDKPRAAGGDPSVVMRARKGDRMRTLRLPVGALLVALMLGAVLAVGASATPVAKTVATVACEGASATLLMHPGGGGKAIWDISVESVQDAPSYLIKRVEADLLRQRRGGGNARRLVGRRPASASRSPVHSRCTRTAWTCTDIAPCAAPLTRHPLRMRLRGASVRRGGARGRGTATRPRRTASTSPPT